MEYIERNYYTAEIMADGFVAAGFMTDDSALSQCHHVGMAFFFNLFSLIKCISLISECRNVKNVYTPSKRVDATIK